MNNGVNAGEGEGSMPICESCGEEESSDRMVLLDGERICHRCVAPGIRPNRLRKFNRLALDIIKKYLAECGENTNLPKVQKTNLKVEDPLVKAALALHQSQSPPAKATKKVKDKVYKTIAEAEKAAYLESIKEER